MKLARRHLMAGMGLSVISLPKIALAAALRPTPPEELGPFYPFDRPADQDFDLTRISHNRGRAIGTVMELTGRVLHTDGSPVARALIDVWQANAAGRYSTKLDKNPAPLDPNFQGSAKIRTGRDGSYRILTVKPGAYPAPMGGMRTQHIHFDVQSADCRMATQMFFPDEPYNSTDMLRSTMGGRGRDPARVTCQSRGVRADGVLSFEWDIVLLMV